MPEIHRVRCDAPNCEREEDMRWVEYGAPRKPPGRWHLYKGVVVCSWHCLAVVAKLKADEGD